MKSLINYINEKLVVNKNYADINKTNNEVSELIINYIKSCFTDDVRKLDRKYLENNLSRTVKMKEYFGDVKANEFKEKILNKFLNNDINNDDIYVTKISGSGTFKTNRNDPLGDYAKILDVIFKNESTMNFDIDYINKRKNVLCVLFESDYANILIVGPIRPPHWKYSKTPGIYIQSNNNEQLFHNKYIDKTEHI